MIEPGTLIRTFTGDATVVGYAQPAITLRTIDGLTITRRVDKISERPKEVYRLSDGWFLRAGEESRFHVVVPYP